MTDPNHPAEKMLAKFEKDFKKLLAKYPEIRVCCDLDGYLRAITVHGMNTGIPFTDARFSFFKRYLPQAHQPEPPLF